MSAERQPHYATLGLRPGASPAQIKAAYRRRAREVHPDHNAAPDAEARFIELRQAYEALCRLSGLAAEAESWDGDAPINDSDAEAAAHLRQRAAQASKRSQTANRRTEPDVQVVEHRNGRNFYVPPTRVVSLQPGDRLVGSVIVPSGISVDPRK